MYLQYSTFLVTEQLNQFVSEDHKITLPTSTSIFPRYLLRIHATSSGRRLDTKNRLERKSFLPHPTTTNPDRYYQTRTHTHKCRRRSWYAGGGRGHCRRLTSQRSPPSRTEQCLKSCGARYDYAMSPARTPGRVQRNSWWRPTLSLWWIREM